VILISCDKIPADMTISKQNWIESYFIPYKAETSCPSGSVLIFAPHPDDEVLGCGGAIMHHLAAGDLINVVVVTDSNYGLFNGNQDGVQTRRAETLSAAKILGYDSPIFWGLRDRELCYDEILIDRISLEIARRKPDILYAPSWWEIHPDHYVISIAVLEAAKRSKRKIKMMMYEVGVPLYPNYLLDITLFNEKKQLAISCFESQIKVQRYDMQIAGLNRFRTYTLPHHVHFAEAYRLIDTDDFRRDPLQAVRKDRYYAQRALNNDLAQPLVSVICLCDDNSLIDAIDSCQLQTYKHIEVIAVIGKSQNIEEIDSNIQRWKECRFPPRFILSESPLNLAARTNLAISHSRGDLLLMMGNGCRMEADHIYRLNSALRSIPGAMAVRTGFMTIYTNEKGEDKEAEFYIKDEINSPYQYLKIPICTVMYSKNLINKGCRMNCQMNDYMAVWDFWLQIASSTKIFSTNFASVWQDISKLKLETMEYDITPAHQVLHNWISRSHPLTIAQVMWNLFIRTSDHQETMIYSNHTNCM
jgi:LmbE family N-acetylglucosaminyl deacetylase